LVPDLRKAPTPPNGNRDTKLKNSSLLEGTTLTSTQNNPGHNGCI
jgi:hypothetical protein